MATNDDLSICNLADPSTGKHEESWQTFKPMTTCPNERYSLKRHKEIFMESNFSQNEDSPTKQPHLTPDHSHPDSKRAKSNQDTGCLQLDA